MDTNAGCIVGDQTHHFWRGPDGKTPRQTRTHIGGSRLSSRYAARTTGVTPIAGSLRRFRLPGQPRPGGAGWPYLACCRARSSSASTAGNAQPGSGSAARRPDGAPAVVPVLLAWAGPGATRHDPVRELDHARARRVGPSRHNEAHRPRDRQPGGPRRRRSVQPRLPAHTWKTAPPNREPHRPARSCSDTPQPTQQPAAQPDGNLPSRTEPADRNGACLSLPSDAGAHNDHSGRRQTGHLTAEPPIITADIARRTSAELSPWVTKRQCPVWQVRCRGSVPATPTCYSPPGPRRRPVALRRRHQRLPGLTSALTLV